MQEKKTDLFEAIFEDGIDAICITTNGQYLLDGRAAMGGGCAGVCARRWPQTALRLGKCLQNFGTNIPFVIGALDKYGNYIEPSLKMIKEKKFKCLILSFPTIDDLLDGAKLSLVENSAKELKAIADKYELKGLVLGRPGCGIGALDYKDVKPVLEKYFDNRFIIVSFEHEE